MLNANEIRIGNYIYHNNTFCNPLMRVDPFLWKDNICSDETFQEFDPIPLTPEILEKCGFEKDEDGLFCMGKHLIWLDTGHLQIAVGYSPIMNCPCKYVHQLQNLVYTLTGTELQITL